MTGQSRGARAAGAPSAPRMVTVPVDGGGRLTMPEPAWCIGHPDPRPEHPADFGHEGREISLTVPTAHGPVRILPALLAQRPLATVDGPEPHALVELGGEGFQRFDVQGLAAFADSLCDYAEQVHALAGELAAVLEDGGRS